MEKVTWTVTEPNGVTKVVSDRKKLLYRKPFEITEKTPKAEIPVREGWNEMQARLILVGEMEEK